MPAEIIGGATSVVASSATTAAAGGILGTIQQAGNAAAPYGVINWVDAANLFINRHIVYQVFNTVRLANGMDGDELPQVAYMLTFKSPDGQGSVNEATLYAAANVNTQFLKWNKNWPTQDELNVMFNRKLITQHLYDLISRHINSNEMGIVAAMQNLRFEIPPATDLIQFGVKECFDASVVSRFQYNKELPVAILPYMEMNGLGGQVGVPMPPNSTTTAGSDNRTQAQWFDMYWWAHWDLPSAGQGAEMLHRLYSDSSFGAAPGINSNNHFLQADYDLLLRVLDYPQFWRERLSLISYSPLTRVDTRRMYELDILDEPGVYHSYRAQGYDDATATNLLTFSKANRDLTRTAKIRTTAISTTKTLYVEGSIDKTTATANLLSAKIHWTAANAMIAVWELEEKARLLKLNIANIRSAYYSGAIDISKARLGMTNLGVIVQRADTMINLWVNTLKSRHKYISANKLATHYKNGIISVNLYRARLENLFFNKIEIDEIIANSNAEAFEVQKKQIIAAMKAKAAADKAAVDILLKPYSETNIKAFWKSGVMTDADVYRVLRLKGFTKVAAIQWMITYLKIATTTANAAASKADKTTTDKTTNSNNTTAIEDTTITTAPV